MSSARRGLCSWVFRARRSGRRSIAPPRNRQQALPDTADAYGIVFDQWVKNREPKTAILVVRRGGKTVFAKGYRRRSA